MSKANLVGQIPDSFKNLTLLEHLDLAMNDLTGTIPDCIWKLKNLRILYLFKNKFHGELPAKIGVLARLEIDVCDNQLSGSIPEDLGRLQSLQVLCMFYNNFSGQIPASIGKIATLYDIRLFNNSLTGPLPPELGKNSSLLYLEVASNMLTGKLPNDLCSNRRLLSLALFKNKLTGKIPKSLVRCATLKNLQIQENMLSGNVPAGIWSLVNLDTLMMNDNNLSGVISSTLQQNLNLTLLDTSNNRFVGKIPSLPPNIVVFRGSNNRFSGELPRDLGESFKIEELKLDGNRISGEIPLVIFMFNLISLNLSKNLITGQIPEDLGSLPRLDSLDLSSNRLSGPIPESVGALVLNDLNLSSNMLSGEVPASWVTIAHERSFLSNPGLCVATPGVLNLPPCGSKSTNSRKLSKGPFVLLLVACVVILVAAVVTIGFFVTRFLLRKKRAVWDRTKWKITSFHLLNFREYSMIVRRLTTRNLIGAGGSGQVYRVAVGEHTVAVKKIRNIQMDAELEKQFNAELEILGALRHTNIVKLLCCISNDVSKLLVYEHMENKNLHQWLHGEKPGMTSGTSSNSRLDWPTRLRIAEGVARGLCYMHHECSPPIIHRDVKSSNILLDADFRPKIADFGLARIITNGGKIDTVSTMVGSLGYMSPECAYARKVNEKVDVYSFGVVLLELATGKQAHQGGHDSCLASWVWQHYQEGGSLIRVMDDEIKKPLWLGDIELVIMLGLQCTATLPSSRPTMKDMLRSLLHCSSSHGVGDENETVSEGDLPNGST